MRKAFLLAIVVLLLTASSAGAEDLCRRGLRVVGARATYRTPIVEGRASPRDGEIEVEVASTATVPISLVELALFLGASLKAIEETRASALPTARPRELEDGGLAFRAEVATLLVPGSMRTLRVLKTGLPPDRDLSAVTARVIGCRGVEAVEGIATVDGGSSERDARSTRLTLLAFAFGVVLATIVLVRALR